VHIYNAQLLTAAGFVRGGVTLRGGRITAIFEESPPSAGGEEQTANGHPSFDAHTLDAGGRVLCPGLIDLHVHGGNGADFMQGTPQAFATAGRAHLRHGTTTMLPTLACCPAEELPPIFEAFRARDADGLPRMPGIHLEGPYFAARQAGALSPACLRNPDSAEYCALTEKYPEIFRWTFAPELPGADAFLRHLLSVGILPSFGHTEADAAEIQRAARDGCRLACHLYSGMTLTHRVDAWRRAGAVEGCYLSPDTDAELIADGCHLPHELLLLAYQIMGPDRLCLVTDAMAGAALEKAASHPPIFLGAGKARQAVVIEDGVAKMPDRQAFAGSIATADRLVQTAIAAGIPAFDALRMATATPARIAGLSDRGTLAVGALADLVLFNEDFSVHSVFLGGAQVK